MEVNNKLEIININFLPRKLSKTNPMEASAIASAKENYCHESFCESFWDVVDILCILYTLILTLTPAQ